MKDRRDIKLQTKLTKHIEMNKVEKWIQNKNKAYKCSRVSPMKHFNLTWVSDAWSSS